jgi:signal transduction histidine kinase
MYQYADLSEPWLDREASRQEEWGDDNASRQIVNLARHLVQSGRASLMLPDAVSSTLRVVAGSGVPHRAAVARSTHPGKGIAGLVAQTRQPLLVNGGDHFARLVHHPTARYRTDAFISVPVPLHEGSCGVLSVADPIGREGFRADDLNALQGLATLAGREFAPELGGARLQQLERTVAELRRQLIWVQEAERSRLARELHDEAGHALTLAVFRIDLERVKPGISPEVKEALTQARDAVLGCANSLHDIAFRLRPRILEDLGLIPALRTLTAQVQDLGGLTVTLKVVGEERGLSKEAELAAFRVVQEALTNTRKHAEASAAWVHLAFHPWGLQILVQDNGIGIDADEVLAGEHTGLGLTGMRERVEALGGRFALGKRRARGTRLAVMVPLGSLEGADARR